MAKEIIKEILLKFRGDSKPLERDLKNVEKMASSLQKTVQGGAGGSGPSQLSKTLDTYIKQSQKFGMTVNKDITKFQKTIQEVASKDLKVLQRQTEDLFRKSEDKLRKLRQAEQNIQQLEERGASRRSVQKQQRKAARYTRELGQATGAFEESAEAFTRQARSMPTTPGNPFLEFFGPMAIGRMVQQGVQGVVNLPSSYDQMMRERLSNQSYVAQQPIQQRMAAYRGDLSMALLAQKGVVSAAASDRDRAERAGTWKTIGSTLGGLGLMAGGALAIGASGVLEAASFGAATPLALGIAGAGVAGISAGAGMTGYGIKRAITGDTQREAAEAYNQSLQNRADMLIDTKLYQAFKEEAPRRAAFGQTMGYTSGNTRALIIKGLQQGMLDPEETMAMAEQLRGTAGADRAGGLAVAAGRMNLNFGLSKGTAVSALQTMTRVGVGGAKEAEKALEGVMRRGVAAGLNDYGMREEFTKAVAGIASSYTGAIDTDQLARSVAALLPGGKEASIRDIEAAAGAKQFQEDMFAGKGSPLEDAIVTSGAVNQLRKMGAPVTATTMDLMKSLTIEDIQGKSQKYRDIVGDKFADDPTKMAQMADYVRSRERAVTAPYGDTSKILQELDKKVKSGVPLTEEEADRYSKALGASMVSGHQGAEGLRNSTPEALRAKGLSLIQGQYGTELLPPSMRTTGGTGTKEEVKAITDPAIQKEEERKKNDAYFQQRKFDTQGKTQEEIDKARFTPGNVKQLAEAQAKANQEVKNAGETVDPSQAASQAADAMGRFSTALDALTRKINTSAGQTYGVPRK